MTTCLAVLSPRNIPACVRSLEAIPVDQVWLKYMSEAKACSAFNAHVEATTYDRYCVVADDVIVPPPAWEAVLADYAYMKGVLGHERFAITGWCSLDSGPHRHMANVCVDPLVDPVPDADSYNFLSTDFVEQQPTPIGISFAGMCLTLAHRSVWEAHELQPYFQVVSLRTFACDYHWSRQLQATDTPIFVSPGGKCEHVKEVWNKPDQDQSKKILVGIEPAAVEIRRL